MDILRGDIFMVERSFETSGHEQFDGRPAVVVSNNTGNHFSNCVEVVFLTTAHKKPLPTHVNIMGKLPSTALCEAVTTISKERLGEYIRSCTEYEMEQIDKALMVSLALTADESDEPVECDTDIVKLQTERDLYKKLYEQMLERVFN